MTTFELALEKNVIVIDKAMEAITAKMGNPRDLALELAMLTAAGCVSDATALISALVDMVRNRSLAAPISYGLFWIGMYKTMKEKITAEQNAVMNAYFSDLQNAAFEVARRSPETVIDSHFNSR